MKTLSRIVLAACLLLAAAGTAGAGDLFTVRGLGGGGGTYNLSISPYDPGLILLACDMGGVFRSTDRGATWKLLPFHQAPVNAHRGPAPVFTPKRIYWTSWLTRLCYSDDKGQSWTLLPRGPWDTIPKLSLVGLGLLPARSERFLVSTTQGVWAGTVRDWRRITDQPGGPVLILGKDAFVGLEDGTLLHSADGGANWRALASLPGAVKALTGAQSGGESLLLASVDPVGLLRSTDMGKTWTPCKTPYENEALLAMLPGRTDLVYAQQQGSVKTQQLLRSRDGGLNWEPVFRMPGGKTREANVTPSWVQTQLRWGYYFTRGGFALDPHDANFCLAATQGDVYRSTDGGGSWQQNMMRPLPPLEPGVPRQTSIGLEVTSCWGYHFDPHDPKREYITYTDIGFGRSLDMGQSWSWSAKGSPWTNTFYDLAFDPAHPGRLYAAASRRHDIPHYTFVSRTFPEARVNQGGVVVSDDWGASWTPPYTPQAQNGLPAQVCTTVVLDPSSPADARRLYAGVFGENDAAGVYISEDSGKTWTQTPSQPGVLPNRHVYRLRLHPETGNLYCLITGLRAPGKDFFNPEGGGIWMSDDKGASWRHLSQGSRLNHWATAFAFDPANREGLYVTAATPQGSPGAGGVYKTENNGKNWFQILKDSDMHRMAGSMSFDHTMSVAVHPANTALVFAGTNVHGLFFSRNAGKTWEWCRDFPFSNAQSIAFDPRDPDSLLITTFGAGVWQGSIKRILASR